MASLSVGTHPSDAARAGKFKEGLELLVESHAYAQKAGRSGWDFAVEIAALRETGLTANDLRWLACQGVVEHAREVTLPGHDGRDFRPTGNLTFSMRTCFVLTQQGASYAAAILGDGPQSFDVFDPAADRSPPSQREAILPSWDGHRHELWIGESLVKRYKWPAANQEAVLSAFEEEGWPARILDPLPPLPTQDPKRRLHDTIKCLNRNQRRKLIHFRGDGTGKGVLWQAIGGGRPD